MFTDKSTGGYPPSDPVSNGPSAVTQGTSSPVVGLATLAALNKIFMSPRALFALGAAGITTTTTVINNMIEKSYSILQINVRKNIIE